jgi:hypothetical protein
MKEVPSQAKGIGTFSLWDGFEAGIQSTGGLPDPHLHFRIGAQRSNEEKQRVSVCSFDAVKSVLGRKGVSLVKALVSIP